MYAKVSFIKSFPVILPNGSLNNNPDASTPEELMNRRP